jgi:subtilisin family serine protease
MRASLIALTIGAPGYALSQPSSEQVLPTLETQHALEALTSDADVAERTPQGELREWQIAPEKVPPEAQAKFELDSEGKASAPLIVPNAMILQFKPNVSAAEISDYLESRDLTVIQTFPKIGAVQVEADLTPYFQSQLGDDNANQAVLRGLSEAIKDFQSDPRIQSAAPDVLLRDQAETVTNDIQITNLLTPSNVFVAGPTNAGETTDWGVTDIEADQVWEQPGAQDGVLFGAMDVGFAKHEDLVFLDFPESVEVDDHGNHVAAIGCGRHNGKGIRGVLPNCFVRARAGDFFFRSAQGSEPSRFMVLFSQILDTLERFIEEHDDIRTVNVSLGYNWRSNFGINPDAAESAVWRSLVESHGILLVSMLKLADKRGKVIFSAAGNDSSGLMTPIDAKYASPFNWAAIFAREQNIANNGIIVEAHDKNGRRASFSNGGGHISCPGVDVLSAVARDKTGQSSAIAYGVMSGTSMASPYCAAGHLLLRLVRPGYSGSEAAECMLRSTALSSDGTPMLRLTQALAACPPKAVAGNR